jgi:hypothetical protein
MEREKPTQVTASLPAPLLQRINEMAAAERRSRGNMIVLMLEEAVAARDAKASGASSLRQALDESLPTPPAAPPEVWARNLYGAAETLDLAVEGAVPQALKWFNEPSGAPTPYAAAELVLRGLWSKSDEVRYALDGLLRALDAASAEGVTVEVVTPPRPRDLESARPRTERATVRAAHPHEATEPVRPPPAASVPPPARRWSARDEAKGKDAIRARVSEVDALITREELVAWARERLPGITDDELRELGVPDA